MLLAASVSVGFVKLFCCKMEDFDIDIGIDIDIVDAVQSLRRKAKIRRGGCEPIQKKKRRKYMFYVEGSHVKGDKTLKTRKQCSTSRKYSRTAVCKWTTKCCFCHSDQVSVKWGNLKVVNQLSFTGQCELKRPMGGARVNDKGLQGTPGH